MKIAVLWNINRERNFIMPAGKCIDKNIKRFYKRLKKVKLKIKEKLIMYIVTLNILLMAI